jgi:hypothetical protein
MKHSFEESKNKFSGEKEDNKKGEGNIEKLINFLGRVAQELRSEGVPVNDECRIDIDAFKQIYGNEAIKKTVKKIEDFKFQHGIQNRIEDKSAEPGEQLEMLTTGIFHKFLKNDFLIVRSSEYDDFKYGVDNFIIDKNSGDIICAFDETSSLSDEKKNEVLDKNIVREGGRLQYGLKIENGKLILGPQPSIPIFYLVLSRKSIKKGVRKFVPSLETKSDFEKTIFHFFGETIKIQLNDLLEFEKAGIKMGIKEKLPKLKKIVEKFEIY